MQSGKKLMTQGESDSKNMVTHTTKHRISHKRRSIAKIIEDDIFLLFAIPLYNLLSPIFLIFGKGVYFGHIFFLQYIPKFLIFWLTNFSYIQRCVKAKACAEGLKCVDRKCVCDPDNKNGECIKKEVWIFLFFNRAAFHIRVYN